MKNRFAVAVIILLLACSNVMACTIFCFTHQGKTYFCNNEDWRDPLTEIRFNPASGGDYAWVYLGFSNDWSQGGVNEHGLCYDWVAGGGPFGWKSNPNKQNFSGNLSEELLRKCKNVDEAVAFYQTYNERHLDGGRTFIADKSGNSMLVHWKDGKLVLEQNTGGLQSCGVGKAAVDRNLQSLPTDFHVGLLARALNDASSVGQYSTKYSNIVDLSAGKMLLFQNRNFDEHVEIDFMQKLREAPSRFVIADLFKQTEPSTGIRFVLAPIEQEVDEEKILQAETGLAGTTTFKGDDRWTIQERMDHYRVPGVCVAVIKDHQVAWSKAYGLKDREAKIPVTTNTLFQCASISKPVSAAAALRLVEQGAFDLNTDVNQYLESWKLPDNEFTEQQKVTLKHLLSHTGGVSVHGFLGYNKDEEVPSLIELLNGTGPSNSDPIRVNKVPGGEFRYSGGGYCIMQQMMTDQTGKKFPQLMHELILQPLAMDHCTFEHPLPDSRVEEAAAGYLPSGERVYGDRHVYPEMAPAGLYATADEMARFWIELSLAYQGKSSKLFSQDMAREMLTIVDGMGLGVGINENGSATYIRHSGWNEGFTSCAVIHRDEGYGIVVLTNGNQPDFIDEVMQSVARAYSWQNFGMPEFEKLPIDDELIEKVSGRYDHSGNLLKITSRENRLLMEASGSEPVELFRVGDHQFACSTMDSVIQFSAAEGEKPSRLAFKKLWDEKADSSNVAPRMSPEQRLPIELVLEGKHDEAVKAYLEYQKQDPDSASIDEDRLNQMGYQLLGNKQIDAAISVFKINTLLYPEGFNTYDSLGEAYMIQGETKLGVENYRKSLELNPDNEYARSVVEEHDLDK